jgi:hypothetical protein
MQGASWLAGLCFLLFAGTVQALELGKQRSDYQASPDLRWLEAAPGELSPEQALEAARASGWAAVIRRWGFGNRTSGSC